jgi:PAS domain S-box-containing protein
MEIRDEDFRTLFNEMPEPAFFHDPQFRIIYANPAYCKIAGLTPEAVIGKPYWEVFPKRDGALEHCREGLLSMCSTSSKEEFSVGNKTFLSFSFIDRNIDKSPIRALHIFTDITNLRSSEHDLKKIASQFQILFKLSPDAIMLLDEKAFTDCNPATLKIFGCNEKSDFVGKHPSQFSPVKQPNGVDSMILANERIATAFNDGSNRFEWQHTRLDGSAFPADVLLVAFEQDGKRILQATVRDITAQKNKDLALERALGSVIITMTKAMELRDPYTSGHQSRVGAIASLIAKDMGWPDDRIRGLHMAALVHDLGKIAVPSEILTKPSKLSIFEEKLMEEHPEHGYQLLKDIEFPWPIANFVKQHHERLDGSGYPLGLKGEEIALEAKILGVADTIEAMSTHRPYRPALGLPEALAEIKAQSGIKFDSAVVDAALHIFEGKQSLDI